MNLFYFKDTGMGDYMRRLADLTSWTFPGFDRQVDARVRFILAPWRGQPEERAATMGPSVSGGGSGENQAIGQNRSQGYGSLPGHHDIWPPVR